VSSTRLAFIASGVALLFLAAPAPGGASPANKVTICHATNSVDNPYVQHTVDDSSIVQPGGHGHHAGPVYPAEGWGDIIPPFIYTDSQGLFVLYPGMNFTAEGQAIHDSGCAVHLFEPPTEESTTTTLHVPPSTSEPSTTSTQPPTIPLPSTPTTTPTAGPTQPLTDPPPGVETMPATEAEAIGPGGQTTDLGPLSPHEREQLEAELDSPALAYTGQNVVQLAALGVVAALAGSVLVLASRPRRRGSRGIRPS
jgi:hypothetical protein